MRRNRNSETLVSPAVELEPKSFGMQWKQWIYHTCCWIYLSPGMWWQWVSIYFTSPVRINYVYFVFTVCPFFSPLVWCISTQSLVTLNSVGSARHSSLSPLFFVGTRRIILERWCSHKDLGSARNSWFHFVSAFSRDNVNPKHPPVCAGASLTKFNLAHDVNAIPSLQDLVKRLFNFINEFRYCIWNNLRNILARDMF